MRKTFAIILISITLVFLFDSINFASDLEKRSKNQENNPPVVKIISPKNNSTFSPNIPVHYAMMVSDKEDGDSKYDEINPKEVLLEVKALNDTTNLEMTRKTVANDPPGLMALRTSNCFNCHNFESKLIGPSFEEINKKYKPAAENITVLEKKIREGSTGVWGKVSMPSHPELSDFQIENMVKWILQDAVRPNIHYYIGIEGSFILKSEKNAYLLIGSYTDHGINNTGRLKGQDVVLLLRK